MILHDYRCEAGHRFEAALASMHSPDPACACGQPARRLITRLNQGGAASAGRSREEMPTTWRGTGNGNRDIVRGWHREMTRREKLEEKYPELAGDRRPVLAHEGAYAGRPVRVGDAEALTLAQRTFGTTDSAAAAGSSSRDASGASSPTAPSSPGKDTTR